MNRRRRQRLETKVGIFVKQYARKRRAGWDPNDRMYSRSVEALVRRLAPEDLDALMNGADDEPLLIHRRKTRRGDDAATP